MGLEEEGFEGPCLVVKMGESFSIYLSLLTSSRDAKRIFASKTNAILS